MIHRGCLVPGSTQGQCEGRIGFPVRPRQAVPRARDRCPEGAAPKSRGPSAAGLGPVTKDCGFRPWEESPGPSRPVGATSRGTPRDCAAGAVSRLVSSSDHHRGHAARTEVGYAVHATAASRRSAGHPRVRCEPSFWGRSIHTREDHQYAGSSHGDESDHVCQRSGRGVNRPGFPGGSDA